MLKGHLVGEARRRAVNEGSPKAPPAEEAFFKQVAQWANGGWRMPMPGDALSGGDGAVDTYFYLVDTSNLWNAFGGLTENGGLHAGRQVGASVSVTHLA